MGKADLGTGLLEWIFISVVIGYAIDVQLAGEKSVSAYFDAYSLYWIRLPAKGIKPYTFIDVESFVSLLPLSLKTRQHQNVLLQY